MARVKLSSFSLYILQEHLESMREHILSAPYEETCGILAASDGISCAVYAGENVIHSPVRFQMDAHRQLAILQEIDRSGWQVAAIYHSHPGGQPEPSETDIAEGYDEEAANLIWFRAGSHWHYGAFLIRSGKVTPLQIDRDETGIRLTDVV